MSNIIKEQGVAKAFEEEINKQQYKRKKEEQEQNKSKNAGQPRQTGGKRPNDPGETGGGAHDGRRARSKQARGDEATGEQAKRASEGERESAPAKRAPGGALAVPLLPDASSLVQ